MGEKITPNNPSYDISKFQFTRVLSNNTNRKVVCVLGIFPDISQTDEAIIILEKTAFTEKNLSGDENESYFSSKTLLKTEFINNIYGSFHCFPSSDINGIKTTVIYPATRKHIAKYTTHDKFIVQETPALYENIIKPLIEANQFSLEWVYNILEHKKEENRIIYEDKDPEKGFILLPDLIWDGRTIETLYVLAIVHKRNIKSIRDLDSKHLPLLRNIRDKGCAVIEKKYGIPPHKLRLYFHYQPSFFHLHVHFTPLTNETPGMFREKFHSLYTVINNIELMSDYYKKAIIPFEAYEGDKLLEKIQEDITPRKKMKRNE